MALIAAAAPGFFLLLCGLWSIWLALGQTSIVFRVPVFLLGTTPLGLVVCLTGPSASQSELFIPFVLLAMAVMIAAVFEAKFLGISGICFLCALLGAAYLLWRGVVHSEWLTTTTIALCFLAGLISLIRLLGFRLICFTTDTVSQEIEATSGHDIDQWISILDKQGAATWNYAEIIIFLRDYGFDYRWQKAIAVAYEKTLGRRSVDRTFDGKSQQIQDVLGWSPPDWFGQLGKQRFSIVQILLWSVAAASFFGFIRLVGRFGLTTDDVAIGAPVLIAMALISIAALQGCLGVRDRRPRALPILLVATLCFAFPFAVGLFPGVTAIYVLMVSGMLGYSAWLTLALLLVRQRGYRLVRVHTASESAVPQSH
jgi:hypothetical protein